MDKKQICIKFAREICDILDISTPAIKFVSADRMQTSTQIAALTPDAILIRDDMTVSPELFFAISHELRHSYQIANGADLKGYQASDKISVEQYNLQSLEKAGNYPANSFLIFSATLSMSSSSFTTSPAESRSLFCQFRRFSCLHPAVNRINWRNRRASVSVNVSFFMGSSPFFNFL